MCKLKKADGIRITLHVHKTEDVRVTLQGLARQPEKAKGGGGKTAFRWIRDFSLRQAAIWAWENKLSIWEWICNAVTSL
jgi:signal transduction histidine kinase